MFGAGRNDSRFTPSGRVYLGAKVGSYPVPIGSKLRAVECVHCKRPLGISNWDYWNGFLVLCPHCGGSHGKPWGFERTLLAGLFFNVFGFFFVMRPRQALTALLAFAMADWGLLSLSAKNDMNAPLMFTAISFFALGPVLVNGIALVRHQVQLDKAPPSDPGSRGN
jgi:hypothetical protein